MWSRRCRDNLDAVHRRAEVCVGRRDRGSRHVEACRRAAELHVVAHRVICPDKRAVELRVVCAVDGRSCDPRATNRVGASPRSLNALKEQVKRPPTPGWRTPERGQGNYKYQARRFLGHRPKNPEMMTC